MEPIGLAVGVAGLAGAFSTCVQCLNIVHSARSLERKYQILITKFEVEKTRFLQWGEATGLSSNGPLAQHPSLDKFNSQHTVQQILNCIISLLTDVEKLRSEYGVDGVQENANQIFGPEGNAINKLKLKSFKLKYNSFCSRVKLPQKHISTLARTKWAIRDCDGFTGLVDNIGYFVGQLYSLVPIETETKRQMIEEGINGLSNKFSEMKLLEAACCDRNDDWADITSTRIVKSDTCSQDMKINDWINETTLCTSEDEVISPASNPITGLNDSVGNKALEPTYERFDKEQKTEIPSINLTPNTPNAPKSKWNSFEANVPRIDSFIYQLIPHDGTDQPKIPYIITETAPNNLIQIFKVMSRDRPSLNQYRASGHSDSSLDVYYAYGELSYLALSQLVTDVEEDPYTSWNSIPLSPLTCHNIIHPGNQITNGTLTFGVQSDSMDGDVIGCFNDGPILGPDEIPTTSSSFILPTCFLELESNSNSNERDAPLHPHLHLHPNVFHNGAMAAQCQEQLRSYGNPHFKPMTDAYAYTFTSILSGGVLRIYAGYLVSTGGGTSTIAQEYRVYLLGTWVLNRCPAEFHEGVVAFLNLRDWALWVGYEFIEAAKKRSSVMRESVVCLW